jgi:hypothetical protein
MGERLGVTFRGNPIKVHSHLALRTLVLSPLTPSQCLGPKPINHKDFMLS